MNKTLDQGIQLTEQLLAGIPNSEEVLKIIAPPSIHLATLSELIKDRTDFALAAQDCHESESGAFTGEISASMIRSTGATHVIIGHSERRTYFAETDALLVKKVNAALAEGLIPIFCLGESLEQRNSNQHLETVKQQLKDALFHLPSSDFAKIIIAYEPVWAIGTGVTATSHQAQGMHNFIRSEINKKFGKEVSENISILYGGSCNPQNSKELFACIDLDGGLVGGASLKAADFTAIVNSF